MMTTGPGPLEQSHVRLASMVRTQLGVDTFDVFLEKNSGMSSTTARVHYVLSIAEELSPSAADLLSAAQQSDLLLEQATRLGADPSLVGVYAQRMQNALLPAAATVKECVRISRLLRLDTLDALQAAALHSRLDYLMEVGESNTKAVAELLSAMESVVGPFAFAQGELISGASHRRRPVEESFTDLVCHQFAIPTPEKLGQSLSFLNTAAVRTIHRSSFEPTLGFDSWRVLEAAVEADDCLASRAANGASSKDLDRFEKVVSAGLLDAISLARQRSALQREYELQGRAVDSNSRQSLALMNRVDNVARRLAAQCGVLANITQAFAEGVVPEVPAQRPPRQVPGMTISPRTSKRPGSSRTP